jgi:hypothetical protein
MFLPREMDKFLNGFQCPILWTFHAAGSSPRYHDRIPKIQKAICFVSNETSTVNILVQRGGLKKFGQRELNSSEKVSETILLLATSLFEYADF